MDGICKNCESAINPANLFCPHCSQRTHLHRLSMHDVAHEAMHYFTHADRGLITLFRDLSTKTGTVALEYVNGRRKKHFPPLTFYLLVAATMLFIFSMTPTPNELSVSKAQILDASGISEMRENRAKLFINRNSNKIMILALPIIAFSFWVFYRRARYNYAEHLVAAMYMVGYTMIIYVLLIVPIFSILDLPDNSGPVTIGVFQLLYYAIFYRKFMDKRGIINPFLASLFSVIIWFLLSGGVVALYISNGFFGLVK